MSEKVNFDFKKKARETSFKFIHQFMYSFNEELLKDYQENPERLQEDIDSFLEDEESQLEDKSRYFCFQFIQNAVENFESYNNSISEKTTKQKQSISPTTDTSILILAQSEYYKIKDTHRTVIINESIELAKKYGEPGSSSYVNAVLDSILKKRS